MQDVEPQRTPLNTLPLGSPVVNAQRSSDSPASTGDTSGSKGACSGSSAKLVRSPSMQQFYELSAADDEGEEVC